MVKGLKALERKLLHKIPKAVERELKVAMAIFADQIVSTAETFVPERTGALKNSIGWTWGNEVPKGAIAVGGISGRGDLSITVFAGDSDAFYARWTEFGTVKAAAQPFFFVAYRLNKRGGKSRITRAIKKGLKEGSK